MLTDKRPVRGYNKNRVGIYTLRKSLQTTSASPYRTQVQLAASFLVCSLIFIEYKYEELVAQYPENYLAIYDLPLDTDLNTLDYYPSVWIGKEEFE